MQKAGGDCLDSIHQLGANSPLFAPHTAVSGIALALSVGNKESFMKLAIVLLSLVPALGWAGVSDFNALIDENAKVQRELQHNIEEKTTANDKTFNRDEKTVVVQGEAYSAPASEMTLKFKKESQFRPSNKKELDRLAEEFKSMDREF